MLEPEIVEELGMEPETVEELGMEPEIVEELGVADVEEAICRKTKIK